MQSWQSNLVIVGNGFDLSHNLNSSYSDFLKHLIKNGISGKDQELFSTSAKEKNITIREFKKRLSKGAGITAIHSKNKFFINLINSISEAKWCDIEDEYFSQLNDNNTSSSVKELNNEFDQIKKKLEIYLIEEEEKNPDVKISGYDYFFRKLTEKNNPFISVNFNYTNTLKRYGILDEQILHIHGEVNNDINPIIFGYAAYEDESRDLIKKNENEFLRNIKKHCYKRSNVELLLKKILDSGHGTNVFILGHSCGISDKLILSDIFNHEKTISINQLYYNDYENYFQRQVNIDRIMDNDLNFEKLINFQDSVFMPQNNMDEKKRTEFEKKLNALISKLGNLKPVASGRTRRIH